MRGSPDQQVLASQVKEALSEILLTGILHGVKKRLGRAIMRAAIKLLWLATISLSACSKRDPDFEFEMPAPNRVRVAIIQGFQPRGTIDGKLNLTFGHSTDPAVFLGVRNARMGWLSNNEFLLVGDNLEFVALSSSYFPDGTVGSETRLLVCDRARMDCSSVERTLSSAPAVRHIARFPES